MQIFFKVMEDWKEFKTGGGSAAAGWRGLVPGERRWDRAALKHRPAGFISFASPENCTEFFH